MRSVALLRLSLAASGAVALGTLTAQLAQLPLAFPSHHLQLAWTLARVLLQL
jgi:hypothetical protein